MPKLSNRCCYCQSDQAIVHVCIVNFQWLKEVEQTLFKEAFVHAHEFCHKGLQVEDGLAAQPKLVLVVGSHLCHVSFQFTIAVHHQLRQQPLK